MIETTNKNHQVDQPGLDVLGALCTLLVVQGVLPIDDAANIAGVSSDALRVEAQAWAVVKNRRP